jgi:NAD(P)-dependent dehydrogenase (short-subunit alcohol dehydrogenase family)
VTVDGRVPGTIAGTMHVLAGRVAIVTGAGRGLGRAYARALAAAGAHVLVNDVGCDVDGSGAAPEVASAVVDEIRAAGGTAAASAERVGTAAAGEAIIRAAIDRFGRLDAIVNNAGISVSRPFAEFPPDDWERVLRVHLDGTFACARAAFAAMRAAGHGDSIVNVTSGAGLDQAYPGTAAYAAAKGGVVSLTRVIAAEGAPYGITCNAVAPLARTRMSAAFLADDADDAADLAPEALAPLLVHLASPASAGVNGEVFRFRRGRIGVVRQVGSAGVASASGRWTVEEIGRRMDDILRA